MRYSAHVRVLRLRFVIRLLRLVRFHLVRHRRWTCFPVLFIAGLEGFGSLSGENSALLHAFADLIAKNGYSYASCESPRDLGRFGFGADFCVPRLLTQATPAYDPCSRLCH